MSIRHIITVLKDCCKRKIKTPLGRWNIENNKQTKLKINYANEDHCGSCAEYVVLKRELHSVKEKQQQKEEELYMYMIGTDELPDTPISKTQM
mgnify:FL=1